jgi:hypothetical protein
MSDEVIFVVMGLLSIPQVKYEDGEPWWTMLTGKTPDLFTRAMSVNLAS